VGAFAFAGCHGVSPYLVGIRPEEIEVELVCGANLSLSCPKKGGTSVLEKL
jgi:hypothetical protein